MKFPVPQNFENELQVENQSQNSSLPSEDVCAIVVTYHPDTEFPTRLASIKRQVRAVVIVDNGSADTELATLREIAESPAITLVLSAENVGIARALNIGVHRAAALGYSWVLLFDQDTCIDEGMVTTLSKVYETFPEKQSLAVIGSSFRDTHRPPPESDGHELHTNQWEEVDWVITSGSLLPIAAYSDIGPFRDEFFIDFVDTEFCMRARAKGYHIIKTCQPLMSHTIGRSTQHNLLGMKKWTTNHSADRRYYIARNNTVMLREYGNYVFGWWAVKGFLSCFKPCKRIILYEQMKITKLVSVFQGWRDGVRGKMGPRKKQPTGHN